MPQGTEVDTDLDYSLEAEDFFPDENTQPEIRTSEASAESDSDPELPVYNDPSGSIFSGSVGMSVPTSVSNYAHRHRSSKELTRLSGEYDAATSKRRRRSSTGSRKSHSSKKSNRPKLKRGASNVSQAVDSESEDEEVASRKAGGGAFSGLSAMLRKGSKSKPVDEEETSLAPSRRSSMGSVKSSSAAKLRGRSMSVASMATSRHSGSESENDEDDAYGPYGSSVSTSSTITTDSQASSSDERRRPSQSIPGGLFVTHGFVGSGDAFFGDHRVDMDSPTQSDIDEGRLTGDESKVFDSIGGSLTGERQPLYIPDEDLQLVFVGWGEKTWKTILWYLGCFVTVGILPLLGRWFPNLWLRGKGKVREFSRASSVVAHTQHGDKHVLRISTLKFDQPVASTTIFPATSRRPPRSRDDPVPTPMATTPLTRIHSAASSLRNSPRPTMLTEVRMLDYRYYRLLLHPDSGLWRMARDWADLSWTSIANLRRGISSEEHAERLHLFGKNAIQIQAKTIWELLVDECLHPFYCFQIASIVLWTLDDYQLYAGTIAIISVISIVTTLVETRSNTKRMIEMSKFICEVSVQRNGIWQMRPSEDLVPGDVIDLSHQDLTTFPADVVLISGDAIVNESMLTGESVPVSKAPIEPEVMPALLNAGGEITPNLSKHVLFNGTKIVRIRPTTGLGGSQEAIGMVLRTGFNTTKGALVRSMLFPRPLGFKFYRDSFRFIGVLAGIAGIGFLGSVYNFVQIGISTGTIIKRALDLITITCPPALPATMSIGTSFAISRLRKSSIFCISPNRVNVGGKLNIWVFDKTGTLTEEGLDVLGIRSVDRINKEFSDLYTDVEDVPIIGAADAKTPLLHALATCHALKLVDGELIGDPLDLKMFEFTKWNLEEGKERTNRNSSEGRPSDQPPRKSVDERIPDRPSTLVQTVVRPPDGQSFKVEDALRTSGKHAHFLELGVIRTFDFVSSLRRMAVMVKKLKSKSVEVYVKGAPEVMIDICDKSTLPSDYEELLASYTRHGFRVIAVAAKSVPGLSWIKAQRMKREEAESNLRFLGLIVFENKLKPGTASVIHTLKHARIGTRMCTGDNIRTAVSVARECGMVPEFSRVYIPSFVVGDQMTAKSQLEWTDVEDDSYKLDSYGLMPVLPDADDSDDESTFSDGEADWSLAVSGDAFRWIIDYAPLETLQRMLVKSSIFARMSPDEKHELVDRLQSLGYTVGFCGDGANDCGALKAADVGLSLSEAEASVAAPFTSRSPDISCTLDVVREGRAALVTSFSCFKYMALYSLIQFTTVTLLYSIASSLGDFQFLYIDLFIILPIAVTMGRTAPYPKINPKRPTANLVSKQVLCSLGGQVFITSGLQALVYFYVRSQDWYRPPHIDPLKLRIKNDENSALFLISSFQYILVAAVFCVGPPYRKPLYTNALLLATLSALGLFSFYTLFVTSGPIYKLLQLVKLPREFHLELTLLVILNCVLSWAWEKHGAAPFAKWIGKTIRRYRRWKGRSAKSHSHDGKMYKEISRSMD